MTREQLRSKILQILAYVVEEGLDATNENAQLQCVSDAKLLNINSKDFKSITRTDILHMKEDPFLVDLLVRFCEFMGDELKDDNHDDNQ